MDYLNEITDGIDKWFTTSWQSIVAIFITTLCIYIAVILYTRIFGKRSFSKMSSFDFAMTVAVGSLIASTALSPSISLIDGLVGLFVIYLLQFCVAFLRRWEKFRNTTDNSPLLLMRDDVIIEENLIKAKLTKSDLRSKLRESNVLELVDVRAVVFETTGDVTVLHSKDQQKELEKWLLKDVRVN